MHQGNKMFAMKLFVISDIRPYGHGYENILVYPQMAAG